MGRRTRRAGAAGLAIALAGAAAAARAQPAHDAGASGFGEEVVVWAPTRLAPAASRAADPAVQVVDARQLRASGARTLQEALQRVLGAAVADQQGNALQQDLSMRGLTASPVTGLPQGLSVFLDGVRLNEPGVEEVNFDLVPLGDVERVEVVRGPHAVFGRNTLGGAVHIVTRRGGDRLEVEGEVSGGSSLHQEVSGRVAGPVGALDGYLSLGQTSGGGWRAGGAARGLRSFAKLGRRSEDGDAALSYQFQLDRIEEPGSLGRRCTSPR
jgi:outer membrane cobalamin receptor